MNPEHPSQQKYWYAAHEGYETRSQRRLQSDLGVDKAAVGAILSLRSQVIDLQFKIRQLEAELNDHVAGQQIRLARAKEVYFDAIWIEVDVQE